jgi:hypothetical protein
VSRTKIEISKGLIALILIAKELKFEKPNITKILIKLCFSSWDKCHDPNFPDSTTTLKNTTSGPSSGLYRSTTN